MSTIKEKSFSGDLGSLEKLRAFVKTTANEANISESENYKLVLAVDEVASNIVLYGYERSGTTGTIEVICRTEKDYFLVRLEDTAPAFNPLQVETPDSLDEDIEDRPIGGLGIYLAHGIDKFDYEYKNGKNCNIFVVNRPQD